MIYRHPSIFISMFFMLCTHASAAVNDVFPTDYIAMKDGTISTTLYLGHREQQGPYVNGHKVFAGKLKPNLQNMAESLTTFGDPCRIYPSAVQVKLYPTCLSC